MAQAKYKSLYNEASKEIQQKDAQIAQLYAQMAQAQSIFESQIATINKENFELKEEIETHEKLKSELEESLAEKKEQLRKMELSRFASAYANQEKAYETQQKWWFKLSLGATFLLVASVVLSTFLPVFNQGKQWYEEPGFYLLNFIFVTLFIYTLKQHSHLGNLRIDYSNRKTLAQSYQHIIEEDDDEGHANIKTRFLERAADIFSSKAVLHNGDVTLYEAVLAKIVGKNKE